MVDRRDRQGFLGPHSADLLKRLLVGIVGLGGGGSHIVQQLAHVGVGSFVLCDPDKLEESNLNRLVGAMVRDLGPRRSKVHIAARTIRRVNSAAQIHSLECAWQERAERLRDCDVIFGCIDSFAARLELEQFTRRYLIPYIDIGMDVHPFVSSFSISGQVAISIPGAACLRCMGILSEERVAREAADYGAAGPRPQVVWPNGALASTAVGLMMQLVTPWFTPSQLTVLMEYDGNSQEIRRATASDHLAAATCRHFQSATDLGDPWFAADTATESFRPAHLARADTTERTRR